MQVKKGTPLSAAPSVAPWGLPEPALLLVLLAVLVGTSCVARKGLQVSGKMPRALLQGVLLSQHACAAASAAAADKSQPCKRTRATSKSSQQLPLLT